MSNEAIRFYCGVGERAYNHHPVSTGPYACVSPVCGTLKKKTNQVALPQGVRVIQDSGAFNDACLLFRGQERHTCLMRQQRLSLKDALKRQDTHAERFGYGPQLEARASYDVLIDETWSEEAGELMRTKRRWSEADAAWAVEETVAAAAYLNAHRNGRACVMSAQGVSVQQYLRCAERILPAMRDGDLFGLGGFCILGRMPSLLPAFYDIIGRLVPFLGREGVKRVHIWGVCYAPALGPLLYLCDAHGIQLSTDSMGPSTRPVKKDPKTGYAVWGYASWRSNTYEVPPVMESCKVTDQQGRKAPTCSPQTRCRGLERARHIALAGDWLAHFRERESRWYTQVYHQHSWLALLEGREVA